MWQYGSDKVELDSNYLLDFWFHLRSVASVDWVPISGANLF